MGWSRRVSDKRPCQQPAADWRELRGAACVAQAPQSIRPPLQAAPSGATPCRVPPCPGSSIHCLPNPFQYRPQLRDVRRLYARRFHFDQRLLELLDLFGSLIAE